MASAAPGRCWTNSGPGARWTGPRRSSTRPPFTPKRGIADRAEPGRSRQEEQQAARAVRCPGHPARRRRVPREHARQPRPQAAHPRHTRRPVPPGTTAAPSNSARTRRTSPANTWPGCASAGSSRASRGPCIESGERLGRHRWKIERSIAYLFAYRHLTVRYERKGSHFLAFLGLAAALTCYKKLAKRRCPAR